MTLREVAAVAAATTQMNGHLFLGRRINVATANRGGTWRLICHVSFVCLIRHSSVDSRMVHNLPSRVNDYVSAGWFRVDVLDGVHLEGLSFCPTCGPVARQIRLFPRWCSIVKGCVAPVGAVGTSSIVIVRACVH